MTARSGYRFVPIDGTIVSPPVSFEELHRGRPHKGGSISGTLEVEWKAETPVCVGVDCGSGNVRPFEIDGRGVLPGASLRGMVRAVLEIATFSHLGRINDHRHFGFRNFTDRRYQERVQPNNIKAGWLRYCEGVWTLTVAAPNGEYYPISFRSVLNHIRSSVEPHQWRQMSIHDKRTVLSELCPNLLQSVKFSENGTYYRDMTWGSFCTTGGRPGHLIVGGAATDPCADRANEVFIGLANANEPHVLHRDFMDRFHRINSNPGRECPEPTGAWRYWLGQKATSAGLVTTQCGDPKPISCCRLPGIPVFFCGDPGTAEASSYDPDRCEFVMGLSRVIKIPYREGVSDVAARIYATSPKYRVPKMKEGPFDFARAIFGWIDVDENAANRDHDSDREHADVDALAGRVAFSPAFTSEKPTAVDPRNFVFGAPRESFWRFYLDGDYYGVPGSEGRPRGRKRYPVRSPVDTQDIRNDNVATQSTVSFHKKGTLYRGRIRVHNMHPVELGALIWCLGFGRVDGPWRHSIGRGKGYGYGCLKLNDVRWRPCSLRVVKPANCAAAENFDALARSFEEYMSCKLRESFTAHGAISKLRGYALAENGDRYADRLSYPSIGEFATIDEPLGYNEDWNPSG